jgi:hypothetical protein
MRTWPIKPVFPHPGEYWIAALPQPEPTRPALLDPLLFESHIAFLFTRLALHASLAFV